MKDGVLDSRWVITTMSRLSNMCYNYSDMKKRNLRVLLFSLLIHSAIIWFMLEPLIAYAFPAPYEVGGGRPFIPTPKEQKNYSEKYIANVSAYTSRVAETDSTPHITASGERVFYGGVACPRRYKFGTKVLINGQLFICNDRMNIRYANGNKFDIWMAEYEDAIHFGRKNIEIRILK